LMDLGPFDGTMERREIKSWSMHRKNRDDLSSKM